MRDVQTMILAAGEGTRMQSSTPKVLHSILGEPMLRYVAAAAVDAGSEYIVPVLGHGRREVEAYLEVLEEEFDSNRRFEPAIQNRQLGTADAVRSGLDALDPDRKYTLILSGDTPALTGSMLESFVDRMRNSGSRIGLVTTSVDDPAGYGRVVRGTDGDIEAIVEERDATPRQRSIREVNTGIYLVETEILGELVGEICARAPANDQGEYYLTEIASAEEDLFGYRISEASQTIGVNDRRALADALAIIQRRINDRWLDRGVFIEDPESAYIGPKVELGRDIEIFGTVHLFGETTIETGVRLEDGVWIEGTSIGSEALIRANSHIRSAAIGPRSEIGPFAHLRPGAEIDSDCRVGNFVEIKNAELRDGAKAGHHAYLGDATVGRGANIGAGTITCNYDGEQKHRTRIGEGAFTGSNSALVAPLSLGKNSYVGAGSTITEDLPDESLGLGRARQTTIENWRSNGSDPEDTEEDL